ncbi:putative transcription factor B3-Domain family [Helianthus debilis subsp. tardiflorus]
MDSRKNPLSFIAFIDKEEPFLMEIPNNFAYNLWADNIPYYKTVDIRDGENLRKVRITKKNDRPVFTDGWIMLVRHNQLKYKDGILIKAVGQLKFKVLCYKDLVCQNSFITAAIESELGMCLMADKFFNEFYGQNFKGGMTKVYFGQRFWNVRLERSSETEAGYFKAGWSKVVEEVPLDTEYFLVFTRLDSMTFDVSVFDPDTRTEVFIIKSTTDDDMIVESNLPDEVCQDDREGSKKDVKGKSTTDDDMIHESNLPDEVCQDDRQGNKKDTQRNLRSRVKRVDAAASTGSPLLKTTDLSQRNLRSRFKMVDAATITGSPVLKSIDLSQRNLRSRFKLVDAAPITGSPVLKSTDLTKRRKTVQKVNPQSGVLNFTRFAETRIRIPAKMSTVLDLSPDNLKEVRVQNMKGEVKNIMTRSEKHGKGFRYGFVGWSTCLKTWKIKMGAELFFEFNNSSKLLRLTKVVEKHCVKKKKLRA